MAPGFGTGTRVHYGGACSCQGANHEKPSHHSHCLAEGLCYQHQPACLCLLNKPITFLNVSHTRVFNATPWSYGPLAGSQCRGHGLHSWNRAGSSGVHCCVQPARRFLWMLSARAPQPLGTAEPALSGPRQWVPAQRLPLALGGPGRGRHTLTMVLGARAGRLR